jgi:hypothetical protein
MSWGKTASALSWFNARAITATPIEGGINVVGPFDPSQRRRVLPVHDRCSFCRAALVGAHDLTLPSDGH